jgi:hypothetical protein
LALRSHRRRIPGFDAHQSPLVARAQHTDDKKAVREEDVDLHLFIDKFTARTLVG